MVMYLEFNHLFVSLLSVEYEFKNHAKLESNIILHKKVVTFLSQNHALWQEILELLILMAMTNCINVPDLWLTLETQKDLREAKKHSNFNI